MADRSVSVPMTLSDPGILMSKNLKERCVLRSKLLSSGATFNDLE